MRYKFGIRFDYTKIFSITAKNFDEAVDKAYAQISEDLGPSDLSDDLFDSTTLVGLDR